MRRISAGKAWQEQWDRVKRYHSRLSQDAKGRPGAARPDETLDDALAFVLHAYHLKDWLKNDPNFMRGQEVENFVSSNEALSLCADIANASKHLVLSKKPRSGERPGRLVGNYETHLGEDFSFDGTKRPFSSATIYVEHKSQLKAIIHVAEAAVAAWKAFLK